MIAPFLWLLRTAVFLILAVPGVPLVMVLAALRVYRLRRSAQFDRIVLQFPACLFLWSNSEDGIDGLRGGDPAQRWWFERTRDWSDFHRVVTWAAFRNPVDGLRWVPILNPRIDPARVRYIGMDHEPAKGEGGWYFAWLAGTPYSCIRIETRNWRFWLGNKLKPTDRFGLSDDDPRAIRCDFATQFKRVARRKGEREC